MRISYCEMQFDTDPGNPDAPAYFLRNTLTDVEIGDTEGNVVAIPHDVFNAIVDHIDSVNEDVLPAAEEVDEKIPF